ncbi:AraC family transcriptional regulator, partial [Phocaeicola coprocola]|nr:AraC family transcriptional regulator [Phocaeicola coprocola]
MQTNFIEQLSATAPECLEQATAALCGEVKGLLKARTPKRYLTLEPYARDTNLCHHLLDLLTEQPALP